MAVSAEDQEQIVSALRRVGANLPCPRCGGEAFTPLNGYISEPIQENLGHLQVGGLLPTIHTVVMVCDRCGYLAQHALQCLQREDDRAHRRASSRSHAPPRHQ